VQNGKTRLIYLLHLTFYPLLFKMTDIKENTIWQVRGMDREQFIEYVSSLSLRDYAYLVMSKWYTINFTLWADNQKMYSLHKLWDNSWEMITFWFHPDDLVLYIYDQLQLDHWK